MRIQIIDVEVTNKGKYDQAEVSYKNLDSNKTESKKIMSFTNKDVFNTIKESKKGEQFNVTTTKDDKGYWQWSGIGALSGEGQSAGNAKGNGPTPTFTPKSTYETPEERAKKQIYIVRQSSISAAIETLKTDKKNPTKEEVVEVAKFYEDYVFGKTGDAVIPLDKLPVQYDLGDDIPY
jgi:hypothetical protein